MVAVSSLVPAAGLWTFVETAGWVALARKSAIRPDCSRRRKLAKYKARRIAVCTPEFLRSSCGKIECVQLAAPQAIARSGDGFKNPQSLTRAGFATRTLYPDGQVDRHKEQSLMRAWLMDSFQGVEKLRRGEVADPQPGPGQVLLKVQFAALNPADAFLAQALYPAKPSLPHILGRDGVGEIVALGAGVTTARVGEMVGILRGNMGVEAWGTLAEKVVVPTSNIVPVPTGWSPEEMAAGPLVLLTAWQALTQWSDPPAPPPENSVLLVTGASGGVGTASVLLGKSMKLTVVALSRSAAKGAKLKELGADFVLNPEEPNLRKAVMAAIAPRRVDLAVDNVGGALFNEVIATLGQGGRVSVVGRSAGAVPEFNTATLLFRRNRIGGVTVGDYTPEAAQAVWKAIVGRLGAIGKGPVVDQVFGFEDVLAAFARLAQGPMGKVLVSIAGDSAPGRK
jgi:NADPH2:quinone reductase